ncbi:MAG: preprotein translocase subunit SecG [Gammaproteobacteria bacterium]|nr:preprotein translocase subunit SecG [Gammaproteobacteria bacterium]
MLNLIILIVHVVAAVGIIGLVLMQHGQGAEAGASFGGGASQTVFGSQGAGSFLTRTTAVLATLFFATSLSLAYLSARKAEPTSVMEGQAGMVAPAVDSEPSSDVMDDYSDLPPLPE